MKVSVICCYTNEIMYNDMKKSISSSLYDVEFIAIDNRNNKFLSCASALNYATSVASGELMIFIHQDVIFTKDDAFDDYVSNFLKIGKNCVAGVVGALPKFKRCFSTITTGMDYEEQPEEYKIDKPKIVQTFDECLFMAYKEYILEKPFDEKICDGWHLYAVDLCLNARMNNVDVYVLPCNINHFSNGNVDVRYMKTFRKIMKKYRNEKYIYTSCKKMPNIFIYYLAYFLLWKIHLLFRRKK